MQRQQFVFDAIEDVYSSLCRVPNMFSTSHSKPHSLRKRMVSNIYSKSYINTSTALAAQMSDVIYNRLFPLLSAICDPSSFPKPPYQASTGVVNVYTMLSGLTMDIVTAYLFGLNSSSRFTSDPKACQHWLDLYNSRHGFSFWTQETPGLLRWLNTLRLAHYVVPRRVAAANREIEEWTMGMVHGAQRTVEKGSIEKVEDTPVVYQQMHGTLQSSTAKTALEACANVSLADPHSQHLAIASETLDHLAAGFDTSGILLTYLIWELSLPENKHIQTALRDELLTLSKPLLSNDKSHTVPDAKSVDGLPLLQAILWETLRVHPSIPGPQPRITPASGAIVGPDANSKKESSPSRAERGARDTSSYWVPGGIRISANAYCLHRNGDVFNNPEKWDPERWIRGKGADGDDEQRKEMDRWFWAFGSGGRMCIGSNLAIYRKCSQRKGGGR
jgi:cytochrome P450